MSWGNKKCTDILYNGKEVGVTGSGSSDNGLSERGAGRVVQEDVVVEKRDMFKKGFELFTGF
jgi:hypothetical protein